ncbi:MAG: hypothetical protein IPK83_21565 [Planctomycetes bacterium]|nr:hypothetical protein [Planctomycetota bacterium]
MKLLWFGGAGLVPLAAMWVISPSPYYLLPSQLLAGACWASYEFATFLLLFETIPDDERTSVLTTFNLVNSASIVLGALLGGFILRFWDKSYEAYFALFILSSLGRLAILPLIRRISVVPKHAMPVASQTLTVRPSGGSVDRPILSSIDDPQTRDRLSRSQLSLLSRRQDE